MTIKSENKTSKERKSLHFILLASTALAGATLTNSFAANSFAIAAAPAADTADTPTQHKDEIVISGSRLQGRKEIDAKKKSITIVDTLSQDEIGALPDQNIAESLRRIPGVSSPLDEDEGRFVVIRGIDPNLNYVGLDGMSIATTDDFAGGGRRVNLEVIPGRAINQLQVYKTMTADLDAGAIGGVTNLVPLSAWDHKGTYFVSDIGVNYFTYGDVPGTNSLHGAKKSRTNGEGDFVFSKTFGNNNQFGIVASAGYQQKQRDQSKTIQPQEMYFTASGATTTPDNANWNGYTIPGEFSYYSYTNRIRAYGGSLRLEWRPSDKIYNSILFYDYSKKESETRNRNRILSFKTPKNMTENSGDMTVTSSRIGWNYNTLERNNSGVQLHSAANIAPKTDIDFRLGYSYNDFKDYEPSIEYRWTPNKSIHYDTSNLVNTYTLTDAASYLNPANYALNTWQEKYRNAKEETFDARFDIAHNISFDDKGFGYQAGVAFRRLERTSDHDYDNYISNKSKMTGYSILNGYVPPDSPYPVLWIDAQKFINDVAGGLGYDSKTSAENSLLYDYKYREDVAAIYASVSYSTEKFRTIFGLRYDDTQTDAQSPYYINNVLQSGFKSAKGGYSHLLPSLNALYNIDDTTRIKFGFSNSLGRPNPEDLAQVENRNDESFKITRGNPNLKPRFADNYDLAFEKYFNRNDGLLSIALFYKNIDDNIYTLTTEQTIDDEIYKITQPMNADSATLKGVEFALINNRLRFMPKPLDRLGVSFNATYTEGEMEYSTDTNKRKINSLPYQMKWSGNAAIFYNWKGNELRIATNYQGEYIDSTGTSYWLDSGWRPFTTTDVTLRLKLSDRMKLKLEARNIGNENRYHVRGINLSDLHEEVEFGRSFFAKLTYKF